MQLVEVKNDFAKILYSPVNNPVLPSDFLLIYDVNQKLISQIVNIETTDNPDNNLAVLRLVLSIDKEDNLSLYNGYIPSKNSEILYINPDEILELIKGSSESVFFGELANHSLCYVKPSINFINDKLYIQSDREDKTKIIIQNLIYELKNKNKKILLVDFDGRYSDLPGAFVVKLSQEFKLPLNSDGLDNIMEHDISDCSVEDKALIQSIILEIKEYLDSLEDKFIPFTVFKNAVDDVFLSNPVSGLMLFRNKLWRYSQSKIFAEKKEDIETVNNAMSNSPVVVADISDMNESGYKYALKSIMNLVKESCYMFLSLDSIELDKKSVIGLYKHKNILPVVCTSYGSKYSQILKSICSNQLLCKPSAYYGEDEKYTEFLNKINTSSMILYGESTLYLPLIVNLNPFNASTDEDVVDNEIKKDVDKLLTLSKGIIPQETVIAGESLKSVENTVDFESDKEEYDEVLDSDLDFLDEIMNDTDSEDTQTESVSEQTVANNCLPENDNEDSSQESVVNNFVEEEYQVFSPVKTMTDADVATDNSNSESEGASVQDEENAENSESVEGNDDLSDIDTNEAENDSESLDEEIANDEVPDEEDNDDEIQPADNIVDTSVEADTVSDFDVDDNSESDTDTEVTEEVQITDDTEETADENADNETVQETVDNRVETQSSADSNDDAENNDTDEDTNINAENIPGRPVYSTEDSVEMDYVTEENSSDIINQKKVKVTDISDNDPEMDYVDEKYEIKEKEHKSDDSEDEDCSEMTYVEDVIQKKLEKVKEIEKPQINENINRKQSETLPVYETDMPPQPNLEDLPFKTGDIVYHPKHGRGVIEGFTNYSNKILFCQIEFENVGRRILDPRIAGIEKIDE